MVASPGPDQHVHVGCIVGRLAQAARRNPAQVFAVLAGIAFVCLLGTFVAQVVLAIVSGVSAPAPYHPRSLHCLGISSAPLVRTYCSWHGIRELPLRHVCAPVKQQSAHVLC